MTTLLCKRQNGYSGASGEIEKTDKLIQGLYNHWLFHSVPPVSSLDGPATFRKWLADFKTEKLCTHQSVVSWISLIRIITAGEAFFGQRQSYAGIEKWVLPLELWPSRSSWVHMSLCKRQKGNFWGFCRRPLSSKIIPPPYKDYWAFLFICFLIPLFNKILLHHLGIVSPI